jgi:hypothetical protein
MSERAREVPFSLARGGHRGRKCRAHVRDDPGCSSGRAGQEGCRSEEAARHDGSERRGRWRAAIARLGNQCDAAALRQRCSRSGGPSRNRTGVQGFAVLCVTTPPSGRKSLEAPLWRASPLGQARADNLVGMAGHLWFSAQAIAARLSLKGGWRARPLPI